METAEPQSVAVLKALADPIRLEILSNFNQEGLVSCGDIRTECPRTQPTVSHHLARLVDCGVLLEQKEGTQKLYQLNQALLTKLGLDLTRITSFINE